MKKYNMKINGEHYQAQILEYNIHRAKLLVNGIEYKVEFEAEGHDDPHVQVSSTVVPMPLERHTPAPETAKPAVETSANAELKVVKSPLPGLVVDIKVNAGDKIAKNQTIAVLEAMKMESEIVSDFAGVVAEVHVNKGETVQEGQQLVSIEVGG